jgi:NAD(P)-dependent dehydrogenase (short-subunit alcohol dehydrogenase family)
VKLRCQSLPLKRLDEDIAVGRYGSSSDIASAVAYLASPQAAFVSGAELLVDGGFTA